MRRTKSRRRVAAVLVLVLAVTSLVAASAVFAGRVKPAANVVTTAFTVTTVSVTGRLVEGARVSLFNDSYKFSAQTTGTDGKVSFSGVPYGTYHVDFSHQLFCSAYYRIVVDGTKTDYQLWVHPKSLWEGIGY